MNLWKYLLILNKNNKETGFTIPLILGFGLFMILIAIASIKMGSSSETSSKLQKTSSQALGAAEVGLARIQFYMDNYRNLALYPDCVNKSTTINPDGTRDCIDTNTTYKDTVKSWANVSKIISSSTTTVCGNSTTNPGANSAQDLAQTYEWKDITLGKPSDGQYRLISYTYTPNSTAEKPPGIGRLVVEGRTGQGVANATKVTATNFQAYNTGAARIQAEIPVRTNTITTTGSVPGLWMKYNNATSMNNDKINGDILIEGCLVPGGVSTSNLYNTVTQKLSAAPDPMPNTPSLAPVLNNNSTTSNYLIGDGIPSPDGTPTNDPVITTVLGASFPRAGDDPAPDGTYYYLIPNLSGNGGSDITIGAGAKVVFYLQGNLDLGGSPAVNMQANGNTPANLQIYGNTTVPNGTGLNGTNYKYGCFAGAATGDCPTTTIYFNGTGAVKALVHAPEATASVKGGGNANGQIQGTLWVSNWIAGSGNSKVKVDAVGNMTDLLSATATTKVEPQITVTSTWVRQGVQ